MQLAITERTGRGMRALRAQAAVFERFRGLDRNLRRLTGTENLALSMQAATELFAHWGDPLGQQDEAYLRSCLAEAVRTESAIVQCGASALTLVLGCLCSSAPAGNKHLLCLESDPHWANLVRSWLTQYTIGAAHVIASRARLYDNYVWYAVDTAHLPDAVSLVLCDGARATPSGVVGSVTRLAPRLAAEFTVLARRVNAAEDLKALNLWAKSQGASFVIVDRQAGFVKLSRRAAESAGMEAAG